MAKEGYGFNIHSLLFYFLRGFLTDKSLKRGLRQRPELKSGRHN